MTEPTSEKGGLVVVGANHRSSSLAVRDRLFIEETDVPGFLERLRTAGLRQALVLSTCDRVEVQAIAADAAAAAERIAAAMGAHAALAPAELDGQLYVLTDADAVDHVFRVTAALDSLVLGEAEVLGQVKAGHRMAQQAGMTGGELEAVLQAAYAAAKRVRSETAIGERPVSIAAAAVQVARKLHGDLEGAAALLVGTGEMGALIAQSLMGAGLATLSVTHPSDSRAERLARQLACHVVPFADLAHRLVEADIVIAAHGARRHAVTSEMVAAALALRRHKPMFLVDAAVPGDVEATVERLEEAFVYTLDDLERVALEGRANREAEAVAAQRILEEEKLRYFRDLAGRAAVPTLTDLRGHFEAVRAGVLAEAGGDAEKATRLLVNRLLHDPSEVMREIAAGDGAAETPAAEPQGAWAASEKVLRRLFRLGGRKEKT